MDEPIEIVPVELPVEEQLEATEELADETEELAGAVQLNIERTAEVKEAIESCRNRLEQLSTQLLTENPLISQILTQLTETRLELENQKQLIMEAMKQSSRKPSESTPEAKDSNEQKPEVSTEEPKPAAQVELPKPKRKVNRL